MESFDVVWDYLLRNLKADTEIKNWTADKGYLGDTMIIKRVTAEVIEVEAPGAKNIQVVPREDFERAFKV